MQTTHSNQSNRKAGEGWGANVLNRFAAWLESLELIALVIVVSTYHYYQALAAHDPWVVAGVIAVFVDLLHYKSITRAAIERGWWTAVAVFTSTLAFMLQLAFYSDQFVAVSFEAILYACIVPTGVAIWAVMKTSDAWQRMREQVAAELAARATALNEREAELNGREETVADREDLQSRVNTLEEAVNNREDRLNTLEDAVNDREEALKRAEEQVKELEAAVNDRESLLKQARTAVKKREDALKTSEDRLNELESTMNRHEEALKQAEQRVKRLERMVQEREAALQQAEPAAETYERLRTAVNPLAWDLMHLMAGADGTQSELAERYNVSAGHVSGLKSKLNGHR